MTTYKHKRAEGPASILSIGKAVPPTEFLQSEYPDFFFNVTNSNDKPNLKARFAKICQNSNIKKRHMICTEEVLKANPSMCEGEGVSLSARQSIAIVEVSKLGARAAEQALKEWDQPREKITHVVFATTSAISMPGADAAVTRSLGLDPSVNRVMLYSQGCFSGGTVLRLAKDLAENNKGARVLTIISEITCLMFRAPSEELLDNLIGSAVFGDGASAMIIGSDPIPAERPLYEVHWSGETLIPDTAPAIEGVVDQSGLKLRSWVRDLAGLMTKNFPPIFHKAVSHMTGSPGSNDLFWCVHPGIRGILEGFQQELGLDPEKLQVSRDVLSEYGNMSGVTVHFVLDRMRDLSLKNNASTTGNGAEWGLLVALGPGLTIEVSVLKSMPSS